MKVICEILLEPHIALSSLVLTELIGILSDTIVCEMSKFVLEVGWTIILSAKTNITFLVNPNFQRYKAANKHPLPNIELECIG